jgi:hypothetical protein
MRESRAGCTLSVLYGWFIGEIGCISKVLVIREDKESFTL